MLALSELAYTQMPAKSKSMIQAFQHLTGAAGGALGMAIGSMSANPTVAVFFASLASVMCVDREFLATIEEIRQNLEKEVSEVANLEEEIDGGEKGYY